MNMKTQSLNLIFTKKQVLLLLILAFLIDGFNSFRNRGMKKKLNFNMQTNDGPSVENLDNNQIHLEEKIPGPVINPPATPGLKDNLVKVDIPAINPIDKDNLILASSKDIKNNSITFLPPTLEGPKENNKLDLFVNHEAPKNNDVIVNPKDIIVVTPPLVDDQKLVKDLTTVDPHLLDGPKLVKDLTVVDTHLLDAPKVEKDFTIVNPPLVDGQKLEKDLTVVSLPFVDGQKLEKDLTVASPPLVDGQKIEKYLTVVSPLLLDTPKFEKDITVVSPLFLDARKFERPNFEAQKKHKYHHHHICQEKFNKRFQ